MATAIGPTSATAHCNAVSFPFGRSTYPVHVAPTLALLNLHLRAWNTNFIHLDHAVQNIVPAGTQRWNNIDSTLSLQTTSIQRWFNIKMLNQRWIDVVSTLCARWGIYLSIYLFKQCLKRMTQLAINNYSTLRSSNLWGWGILCLFLLVLEGRQFLSVTSFFSSAHQVPSANNTKFGDNKR